MPDIFMHFIFKRWLSNKKPAPSRRRSRRRPLRPRSADVPPSRGRPAAGPALAQSARPRPPRAEPVDAGAIPPTCRGFLAAKIACLAPAQTVILRATS